MKSTEIVAGALAVMVTVDLAVGELRVLEDDLADAEADGDVGERRFAGLLAVDPDFRPRRGVDVGAAARIERELRVTSPGWISTVSVPT